LEAREIQYVLVLNWHLTPREWGVGLFNFFGDGKEDADADSGALQDENFATEISDF
jgi:hypothetical protein